MKIRGANVFLTGASSGIGRALASELARRGAKRVVLVARREEVLREVATEVKAAGAEPLVLAADVGYRASIEAALKRAEQETGGLDLVIANAGIGSGKGSGRINSDEVGRITQVNYFGAVWTLLAAAGPMRERRRGHLVAVSSLAALRGLPISTEYSASKAALDALVEGLRLQLKRDGIKVTNIRPGYVDTPINQHMKNRPMVITPADGARRIANGIERDARDVAFPFVTALAMRLVGLLPGWLYDAVAPRLAGLPRD